ncbi:hypothetical protein TNCV_1756621 [Trichonephila clavipes]|nr:hypothetical protein TNCV_1756621 [Trichonephila clavipes]
MNPGYTCSILMAIYVYASSSDIALHLIASDIGIDACTWCDGLQNHWISTHTFLIRIDGKSNVYQYISVSLHPEVVRFLRGLPNAIFQLDNGRPHILHVVFLPF